MKFSGDYKIEKAVSTNESRMQSLLNPYLDTEDKGAPKIVATNSYMLAVIPCTLEDGDTQGPVPIDAIKAARKLDKYTPTIALNGTAHLPNGATFPRQSPNVATTFPPWRQVVPSGVARGEEGCVTIGLDARLLLALAESLGAGKQALVSLTLEVNEKGEHALTPFRITAGPCTDAFGILMPAKV